MSWFKRMPSPKVKGGDKKESLPEGLWTKCPQCGNASLARDVVLHLETCPSCGHHVRKQARERLEAFLDPGSIEELATGLSAGDPLEFEDSKGYPARVAAAR